MNPSELRQQITNEINDVRSQGGDYGLQADAIAGRVMHLITQQCNQARIDENRRSGSVWGGLATEGNLDRGMEYMNKRDMELFAQAKVTEKE
jgi:hypothetical protein